LSASPGSLGSYVKRELARQPLTRLLPRLTRVGALRTTTERVPFRALISSRMDVLASPTIGTFRLADPCPCLGRVVDST
jgi:hypothetical protein